LEKKYSKEIQQIKESVNSNTLPGAIATATQLGRQQERQLRETIKRVDNIYITYPPEEPLEPLNETDIVSHPPYFSDDP
ncbi:hypothetical protein ACJMK2_021391, partial [Sinanodonta woodiana]